MGPALGRERARSRYREKPDSSLSAKLTVGDWSAGKLSLTQVRQFRLISGISQKAPGARKANPVSSYNIEPGARILWCLRRRKSDVRCVIYPQAMPVEVQVVQDRDVVLTERFQEEWVAVSWAGAYSERLRQQGWFDSPGD